MSKKLGDLGKKLGSLTSELGDLGKKLGRLTSELGDLSKKLDIGVPIRKFPNRLPY